MKKIYIYFLLTSLIGFSCKKFISIAPAPNLIETSAVFNSDKTALAAVNGVYIQMRSVTTNITDGAGNIYPALSADDIYNTSANSNYDQFFGNALLPENSIIGSGFWTSSYKNIYRANAILEGLTAATSVTDSLKNQLTGEMKFIRAWYYFLLVNYFGEVPLVITSNYRINQTMPRTPASKVYDQIITDLTGAKTLLKSSYPSSGKVRANKWAATALLSRTFLYLKNWKDAEAQSSEVINSGIYNLQTDLAKVFLINSIETVWEIASPNEATNTNQGTAFLPVSQTLKPALAITPTLLNSFEKNDKRKTVWVDSNKIGTPPIVYYYAKKYKERFSTSPVKEYSVVFRLAEQFLIRAEARAQLDNLSGAIADLNSVRIRAGLEALHDTLTKAEILSALEHERRVELFTEWGHRWLDLKRTGRLSAVLTSAKGSNWQDTDSLYPIPFNELQYNPFLTQNPGY
jgi:starch-binding outer membrane protein, SusD/RagB family